MSDEASDDEFIVERNWYDNTEDLQVVDREIKRFPKYLSEESRASLSLAPSANLQRQLDADKWEDQLIHQSGVFPGKRKQANDEEETETRVYISVNTTRPDFLTNYDSKQFLQQKTGIPGEQEEGLYQLAKAGSQTVTDWKKKKEQQLEQQEIIAADKLTAVTEGKKVEQHVKLGKTSHFRDVMKETGKVDRESLPIWKSRDDILRLVAENNAVIIVGETGSGKTTQVTQFLHEAGYTKFGMIACTQPKRVAAVSVANRVANEMGVKLGEEVGYSIRFEDVYSHKTIIKYMTDGILLRESLTDFTLDKYSVIIMDEAHERSLNTDVMFGVLKRILSKRNDLRVLITSATMDSDKFSKYFGGAPVLNVSGRMFHVDVSFLRSNPMDYVATAVSHICKIHLTEPPGDILVFMTGQDDIECICELVKSRIDELENAPPIEVLPIYSQLPTDLQAKVFEPSTSRKCVVATNIAETSLTINGIRYVIDCGYAKQKNYSSKAGLDTLLVQPISQAAAIQRSGRAGRTMDGKCWRLYTELSFNYQMPPMTVPEIQRTNLANVILLLKSMGFNDVLSFDFMDRPPLDNFMHALAQLWSLRALANDGSLTKLGKEMVMFPLDPTLSKMLLVGNKFHCLKEVLVIVSMLSVPPVFWKPKGREEEAAAIQEKFIVPESDHLTLMNIFNQWKYVGKKSNNRHKKKKVRYIWCKEHFLHHISLEKANDVFKQLRDIACEARLNVNSSNDPTIVRKAICSAYFHQTARLQGLSEYVNLHTGIPCYLHPSSALAGLSFVPEYIVYHELVLTSKHYIHGVTAVDPLWLSQMAPEFFTATDAFGNILEEGKPLPEDEDETVPIADIPAHDEHPSGDYYAMRAPPPAPQVYAPPQQALEIDSIVPPPISSFKRRRKMK